MLYPVDTALCHPVPTMKKLALLSLLMLFSASAFAATHHHHHKHHKTHNGTPNHKPGA